VANIILSRRVFPCDAPDPIPPIIVETGPLKNKSIIPVPFFEARKVAAGWPALPRIPPQIHHQNTTFYHPFSSKIPVKHHKQPQQKKCKKGRHFTATKTHCLPFDAKKFYHPDSSPKQQVEHAPAAIRRLL
jgi:hypothetical protein